MKKIKLPELVKVDGHIYKKITASYGECSGCEQTSPNGGCHIVNNKCVWIPEIGLAADEQE